MIAVGVREHEDVDCKLPAATVLTGLAAAADVRDTRGMTTAETRMFNLFAAICV